MIDIGHSAARRLFANGLLGLFFRADKKYFFALTDRIDHKVIGRLKKTDGLLKVDNVDVVSRPEDVGFHLRIPFVGLMSEMDACFE